MLFSSLRQIHTAINFGRLMAAIEIPLDTPNRYIVYTESRQQEGQ